MEGFEYQYKTYELCLRVVWKHKMDFEKKSELRGKFQWPLE